MRLAKRNFVLDIYSAVNCDILFYADSSVDAPPSFKPAKKYADLSGLPVSVGKFQYIAVSVNKLSLFLVGYYFTKYESKNERILFCTMIVGV